MLSMAAKMSPFVEQQPSQFNVIQLFFIIISEAVAFQEDEVPVPQIYL